jgi:hypothetical protein
LIGTDRLGCCCCIVIIFSEFWVSFGSGWHSACHDSELKKQSCALFGEEKGVNKNKKGLNKNKLEMHYYERKKE